MHWIDIVFIAVILIFAIVGLVKGLFDSILSLCASVASVFLSFWAGKPVAAFLNKLVDVNSFFVKGLTSINVTDTTVPGYNLEQLATVCTIALSMVVVFILIKVAVWLLAKLFDSVTASSTAASGLNRLLGLIFGAVQGFAIVLVVLGVTSIVSIVGPLDSKINTFLEPSKITRGTYNYVDEWVQDELRDKIEEFVQDLSKTDLKPETDNKNYAEIAVNEVTKADFEATITDKTSTEFKFNSVITKTVENVEVQVAATSIVINEIVGTEPSATPTLYHLNEGVVTVPNSTASTSYKVTLTLTFTDAAGNTATTVIDFNVETLADVQP